MPHAVTGFSVEAPARIICLGNPLAERDAAGPLVLEYLWSISMPAGVEVIDGGLQGLSLLGQLEGARRIVFVDQVQGFAERGEVVVIEETELLSGPAPAFGHAGGLEYLVKAAKMLWGPALVPMVLVGIEAPCSEESIHVAAQLALALSSSPAKASVSTGGRS